MGLSYLGCFQDAKNKDLKLISNDSSPKDCFKAARNKGFEFVSMQFGKQCFGSNKVGKLGDRPETECNIECS